MVVTKILTTKEKNIAGHVLTYNSKNFHLRNKNRDQEWSMSELEKPISKNQMKKTENQCQNAVCEQKNQKREKEIWFKRKTRPRMNYEWIAKTISKKNIQKNEKTVKTKVRLPHANKNHKRERELLFKHRIRFLL